MFRSLGILRVVHALHPYFWCENQLWSFTKQNYSFIFQMLISNHAILVGTGGEAYRKVGWPSFKGDVKLRRVAA